MACKTISLPRENLLQWTSQVLIWIAFEQCRNVTFNVCIDLRSSHPGDPYNIYTDSWVMSSLVCKIGNDLISNGVLTKKCGWSLFITRKCSPSANVVTLKMWYCWWPLMSDIDFISVRNSIRGSPFNRCSLLPLYRNKTYNYLHQCHVCKRITSHA